MIINTGMRTDIPAFYPAWLSNRIRDGFVLVRNPYYREQVTKYRLSPEVVDVLAFCTKNPEPMLEYMDALQPYRQFWFVTITPYGKEIEPNVPNKDDVMDSFIRLSQIVGRRAILWRYDPVFITERYTLQYHVDAFERMSGRLEGHTDRVVISFIDLYQKTKRNFPDAREVSLREREYLAKAFAESGKRHNMIIHSCCEGAGLKKFGIDVTGCMTKEILEQAIGEELDVPKRKNQRQECNCILGNDIGMYNTCAHYCKYCYANYDRQIVDDNMKKHDPESPFLIGKSERGDVIHEAQQKSFISGQMRFDLLRTP